MYYLLLYQYTAHWRDNDTAFRYHRWFSFILWWGCWYKYEPFWQIISVKSLILRWPLRPMGLLFVLLFSWIDIFCKSCWMLTGIYSGKSCIASAHPAYFTARFWENQRSTQGFVLKSWIRGPSLLIRMSASTVVGSRPLRVSLLILLTKLIDKTGKERILREKINSQCFASFQILNSQN